MAHELAEAALLFSVVASVGIAKPGRLYACPGSF